VKHAVGRLEDFPPGSIEIREIASRSVGIVNTGSKLYAVLNLCPHARAPVCEGTLTGTMLPCSPGEVAWGMENRILRCPWHGWEFDLEDNGKSVFTGYRGRVRMYPVSVDGGTVSVEMNERPDADG
jgi:3-phenylpropionate/trans-cinnamate dioxygenase ferredoxin subunit